MTRSELGHLNGEVTEEQLEAQYDANGNALYFAPLPPIYQGSKWGTAALRSWWAQRFGRAAANGERLAAKAEVFAARKAPELKQIYGWGTGLDGVRQARAALNPSAMQRIQGSLSRTEVEAARDFYRAAAAQGRGGQVAVERAAYMEQILKLWQ